MLDIFSPCQLPFTHKLAWTLGQTRCRMIAATIHKQQLSNFLYAKEADLREEENWKKRKSSTSSGNGKDLLWKEYFRDPSKWLDNRKSKPSPRYPDFKHKVTREPLWIDSRDTPSWVIQELRSRSGGDPCHESESQADAFVASLRVCTRNRDLVRGTSIHDDLLQRGLLEKCSHSLVIMYAKCGELQKAKELLDMHKGNSNVVTWTALIAGYVREGHSQNALDCFELMQREGILPDAVTYACILKACAMIRAADKGKQIHDEIARQGLLQNDIVLGNALVDMYVKCGSVSKARQVLDGLPSRTVVSWTALIAGYAQEGQASQVLDCFEEMQREGIHPDAATYTCVLKACATIRASDKGKQIHDEIERQGLLQNDIVLGNALVDMYAKCGAVSKARQVLNGLPLRNVVSWNALIAGYTQEGHAKHALDCFEEMQCEGILPDVVSWNALIVGYVQEGHAQQALDCFEEMQHDGILPSAVTYTCILNACAMIGAADKGKQIHDEIARQGLLQNSIVLGSALVDMYAKCGAVSKAQQVLDGMPSRNVVSWNALIAGYAQEGYAEQALECFEEMQREGILPDVVTCAYVLNVCSHRGLVEKGQALFVNMSTKYGVNPSLDCYACMVDLFGRAGHLEKAVRLIQDMPSSDHSTIWHTLLGACQKWADINVGRWAFERAVKLDKSDGPAYVLMANIYATAGMGHKAKNIEAMRIRNRAWKKPGCSVGTTEVTLFIQSKCIYANKTLPC